MSAKEAIEALPAPLAAQCWNLLELGKTVRELGKQVTANGARARQAERDWARDNASRAHAALLHVVDACCEACFAGDPFAELVGAFERLRKDTAAPFPSTPPDASEIDFAAASQEFRTRLEQLERAADEAALALPWQVRYSGEMDPLLVAGAPGSEVVFEGGAITDANGRELWRDDCSVCGMLIQLGAYGDDDPRWHCLDCPDEASLCVACHAVLERLNSLQQPWSQNVRRFVDAHADHRVVCESSNSVFLRLGAVDQLATLSTNVSTMLRQYASRPMFGVCGGADLTWHWFSYGEVGAWVEGLAAKLTALRPAASEGHAGRRAYIGILASNSPFWYAAELAAVRAGDVPLGLSTMWGERELAAALALAPVEWLFVDDASAARLCARPQLHAILAQSLTGGLVMMPQARLDEPVREDSLTAVRTAIPGCWVGSLAALLRGEADIWRWHRAPLAAASEPDNELYTLLFSSGSTGLPKGVRVTSDAWLVDVNRVSHELPNVVASYLPSCWGNDRLTVWRALSNGGAVGVCSDAAQILPQMRTLRPTYFFAMPALLNTLFAMRNSLGSASNVLGDRLRVLASGGAPINTRVQAWVRTFFSRATVLIGYGTSECSGITTNERIEPGVSVRLRDLPELGFTNRDQPHPRGEILVRTRLSFDYAGEARGSALEADGYYATGDVGEMPDAQTLRVIGRRKNTFKTARGVFVCPERIEEALGACAWCEAVVVHGEPGAEALAAIVSLPPARLRRLHDAGEQIPAAAEALERRVLHELRDFAQRLAGLSFSQLPDAVIVDSEAWTQENGLLNSSAKVARAAVLQRHAAALRTALAVPALASEHATVPAAAPGSFGDAPVILALAAALLGTSPEPSQSFLANGGASLECTRFLLRVMALPHAAAAGLSAATLLSTPLGALAAQYDAACHTVAQEHAPSIEALMTPRGSTRGAFALGDDALAELRAQVCADAVLEARTVAAFADWRADGGARLSGVLVTGATGFVGAHVAAALVGGGYASVGPVFALVRAADRAEAERRLAESFARLGLSSASASAVRAVPGALDAGASAVCFGAGAEDETALSGVAVVIHSAASTNFVLPYALQRGPNVAGTQAVLRFVAAAPGRRLVHVSSLSVLGAQQGAAADAPLEPLATSALLDGDGYTLSKRVAEALVLQAPRAARVVARLGFVGPCASGIGNSGDWLTRVLATVLELPEGAFPQSGADRGVVCVAVEDAARALADLATQPSAADVCHVADGPAWALPTIWLAMGRVTGRTLTATPLAAWLERVSSAEALPAGPLVPFLTAGFPRLAPGARSPSAQDAERLQRFIRWLVDRQAGVPGP